ncbi:hypothetical protein PHMEG_00024916 [Phytophthora megakarya]|uniref:Reverse transcriptase n=1 Tax=Phytophthora megakarya TaxID=4795 RepID=A0A225VCX0_9STRA|nr:hypothetical protein PHMEG_00024916 [Phytophthora megakarya]
MELGGEAGIVPTAEQVMIATMTLSNVSELDTTIDENRNSLADRVSVELPDKGNGSSDTSSSTTPHCVKSTSEAEMDELEMTYRYLHEGNQADDDDDYIIHEAKYIALEDYARELAFLRALVKPSVAMLDYDSPNVKNAEIQKLYELLKRLLTAGLIAFPNIPWASPIVIVLKNGQDIRLCIDYTMVNYVTAVMEYAIAYGNFAWLRMPFRLKNVPMIYQRINDNALLEWLEEVFKADRDWLLETDPVLRMVNTAAADMFATNLPDQSVLIPSFQGRSFVDDICFGVCYIQLAEKNLHVYTRFSTLAWVHKSKSLFERAVQFAVLLSPWELEVERIKEKTASFRNCHSQR